MSLPIILAIVLTAAILAWAAIYFVVRRRREAAANQAFQPDPMDAEIGREALRRVFGILADEDPTPVGQSPVAPIAAATAVMADRTAAPTALGPVVAGAAAVRPPPPPHRPRRRRSLPHLRRPVPATAQPTGGAAPVAAAAIAAAALTAAAAASPTAPSPDCAGPTACPGDGRRLPPVRADRGRGPSAAAPLIPAAAAAAVGRAARLRPPRFQWPAAGCRSRVRQRSARLGRQRSDPDSFATAWARCWSPAASSSSPSPCSVRSCRS